MEKRLEFKKNFLRFYIDPELLTTKEAEEALKERGVDIAQVYAKGDKLIKKLEARLKLDDSKNKEAEFNSILQEFKKKNIGTENNNIDSGFKMAARKKDSSSGNYQSGEINDAAFMEYLKKKNRS